jgi:anthranilate 1,2-dioxygenase ferredoxin subunit
MGDMNLWHDVGAAADFSDEAPVAAVAGGHPLAVFRLGDELFALRDKCSHGNARLSDGYIEDGCVECPLHQGLFDIRSGAPRSAPCTVPVRSFPVRVVAGRVEVDVAEPGAVVTEAAVSQLTARIDSIARVASDVAVLRLQLDGALAYQAGQHLDVLLPDGQRRSYSMASPSGTDHIELHVRHMPGGLFTDRVFGDLCAGHPLALEGPAGDFYLRPTDAPVILLASGTGFAPVKALVEQAIASGNTRPFHLYWGGRRAQDLYMDALCREWAATLPWLRYTPVLSEAGDAWDGRRGLVHRAVMEDVARFDTHEVYACGAPAMVAAARADFAGLGLVATRFYADAFLSQADLARRL